MNLYLATKRALIVDDDCMVLRLTAQMLVTMGFRHVAACLSGHEALQRLKADVAETDLLLLDLMMPGLDGICLLRELANMNFQGYVVLMSGSGKQILGALDRLASPRLKVLGTIEKPVTRAQIDLLLQKMNGENNTSRYLLEESLTNEDIASGLAANEFIPFFQPKVELHNTGVNGFEALARWQRSNNTLTAPTHFISIAESNGQIFDIDMMVFAKTCHFMRDWAGKGYHLTGSVNLSATTLDRPDAFDYIRNTVQQSGVNLHNLVFELTESVLIEEASTAMENVLRLHLYGARLSMDDFGNCYSGMRYLHQIPFSELKIDRSFVSGAKNDRAKSAIIESSIELASRLNLKTVCEGVETHDDYSVVKALGANMAQGYFYTKPLPPKDFIDWLKITANEGSP